MLLQRTCKQTRHDSQVTAYIITNHAENTKRIQRARLSIKTVRDKCTIPVHLTAAHLFPFARTWF